MYRIMFILQTLDNLRSNGNFFELNFELSKKIVSYELKTLTMNGIYAFKLFEETLNVNNISLAENLLSLYFLENIKSIKRCPKLEDFFSDKELSLLKELN